MANGFSRTCAVSRRLLIFSILRLPLSPALQFPCHLLLQLAEFLQSHFWWRARCRARSGADRSSSCCSPRSMRGEQPGSCNSSSVLSIAVCCVHVPIAHLEGNNARYKEFCISGTVSRDDCIKSGDENRCN